MWNDLRFALRLWRREPGTTATIVLSVALGIAAVSTIYSWAQGLLLRPLPAVRQSDQLVSLKPRGPGGQYNVAWQEFQDWRAQATSYAGAAAFGIRRLGLREADAVPGRGTAPLWGMLVTGEYFTVLGVAPQLGRLIDPEDTRVEGGGFVGVISDALWRRHFGGTSDILGRRLTINGRDITVVGVAAQRFAGTYVGLSFDIWLPVTIQAALGGPPDALRDRDARWLQAFARLQPGTGIEQAQAEAGVIGRGLAREYAASHEVALDVQPLDVGAASRLAPLFGVLLGLAVVVLVVVCATVSNLLLVQATRRGTEMAIRVATGARPGRLVRQLVMESALLAALGGGLGTVVAVWGRGLFPALLPPTPLPLAIDTPLDGRVIALAVTLTAVILLVFGLVPALGAVRTATAAGLRGAGGADRTRARWRRGLVAAQIAFSLTALACTAMFGRRLLELRDVDRGFDAPERVLLATTDLDLAAITDPAERRSALRALLTEASALPGVTGATIASFVPLGFTGYHEVALDAPAYEPTGDEPPRALLNEIGPDYFDVMGIALVAGRSVEAGDRADGLPVAVVNQALVERLGLGDAVGQTVRLGSREVVVVGVAQDGKYRFDALDDPAPPLAYVPWTQWGAAEVTLHLRTRGEPTTLVPALSRTFARVDPRLPVLAPTTLDAYTSLPLFPGRLVTTVVGLLALGALALSAMGLYGVTRLVVAARAHELGLRKALGAGAGHLMALLFRDAARFAALGLIAGVGLALVATRALFAVLPHLRPDPMAVVVAGLLLLLITVAAVAAAARRALRIDPAAALRDI